MRRDFLKGIIFFKLKNHVPLVIGSFENVRNTIKIGWVAFSLRSGCLHIHFHLHIYGVKRTTLEINVGSIGKEVPGV